MTKIMLSPNFSLKELCNSTIAKRNDILNSAQNKLHIENLTALAKYILQPVRDSFGPFSPVSCFRSYKLNKFLGGASNSQHLYGQAADLDNLPGLSNYSLAEWIANNLTFDQLILEKFHDGDIHSGWVHVSFNNIKVNRGEILRYDTKNNEYSKNTYYPFHF